MAACVANVSICRFKFALTLRPTGFAKFCLFCCLVMSFVIVFVVKLLMVTSNFSPVVKAAINFAVCHPLQTCRGHYVIAQTHRTLRDKANCIAHGKSFSWVIYLTSSEMETTAVRTPKSSCFS